MGNGGQFLQKKNSPQYYFSDIFTSSPQGATFSIFQAILLKMPLFLRVYPRFTLLHAPTSSAEGTKLHCQFGWGAMTG